MSSSFHLTLDTRAPVVTWGAVGGATAGDTLEVMYTTDEAIAVATLWLPDGRRLAMTVLSDRLTLQLPADTPDGISWIHAADDVLNEAPRQAVQIAGVIIVPPVEPEISGVPQGGGRQRPSIHPDRVETRMVRLRSRGEGHTRSTTRRTPLRRQAHATVKDLWTVDRAPLHSRMRISASRNLGISRSLDLRVSGAGSSRRAVHRRDGPDEEAILVVLDLL